MITSTSLKKKFTIFFVLLVAIVVLQAFTQQQQQQPPQRPPHDEPAPKNLQILPKNTSGEDVKKIMRAFTKSLGVKCNHCHVSSQKEGNPFPDMDFASDDKSEKKIARKMMVMVDSINTAYLGKIGEDPDIEKISCVTCHMGRATPIVSVDSLMKK